MIARLHRQTFEAMGTTCEVAVAAGRGDARRARQALAAARAEIEACESVADALRSRQRPFAPERPRRRMGGRRRTRGRPPAERAPRPLGHERQVRSHDPSCTRRPRLRPQLRGASSTTRAPPARLARRRPHRARPRRRDGAARGGGRRRFGRQRQGLFGRTSHRGDARRLGLAARRARRPRRRHLVPRCPSGRRSMAGRRRRPATAGPDACRPRPRRRRGRHVGTRPPSLRPPGSPSPPDRPVDRQRPPSPARSPSRSSAGEAAEVEAFATALAISTLAESRTLVSRPLRPLRARRSRGRDADDRSATFPSSPAARSPGWRRDSPRRSSPRMDHRPRRRTRGLRAAHDLRLARARHEHSTPGAPAAEGAPGLAPDARLDRPLDARPPCWGGLARPGSPSRPARSAGSLHGATGVPGRSRPASSPAGSRSCSRSRSGCGSGSARGAGAACTTRASVPSPSHSGTRSPPGLTWPVSERRSLRSSPSARSSGSASRGFSFPGTHRLARPAQQPASTALRGLNYAAYECA